jgi:hypothetical protein
VKAVAAPKVNIVNNSNDKIKAMSNGTDVEKNTTTKPAITKLDADNKTNSNKISTATNDTDTESYSRLLARFKQMQRDHLYTVRAKNDEIQSLRAQLDALRRGPVSDALFQDNVESMVNALKRERDAGNSEVLSRVFQQVTNKPVFAELVEFLNQTM